MNKILRRLLLFDLFEIRVKLSSDTVGERICAMAEAENSACTAKKTARGFTVTERGVSADAARGAFAPIAHVSVSESGGVTTVSGITRIRLQTLIPFGIFYVCGFFSLILIPIIHVFLHFAFFKHAKRLRRAIEQAIKE